MKTIYSVFFLVIELVLFTQVVICRPQRRLNAHAHNHTGPTIYKAIIDDIFHGSPVMNHSNGFGKEVPFNCNGTTHMKLMVYRMEERNWAIQNGRLFIDPLIFCDTFVKISAVNLNCSHISRKIPNVRFSLINDFRRKSFVNLYYPTKNSI